MVPGSGRFAQIFFLPATIRGPIQGQIHQLFRSSLVFQRRRSTPGFEVRVGVVQRFDHHLEGHMALQRDAHAMGGEKGTVTDGGGSAAEKDR